MKLTEVHGIYHPNVRTWITQAKYLAIEELQRVLEDESERDPNWFVSKRESRLRQLVSEILTMTLQEVSDENWSVTDFEGHSHSDQISQAINDIVKTIEPIYHQLRTELLSRQMAKKPTLPNKQETLHNEERSSQIDL